MVVQPDRPGAESRSLERIVDIRHSTELDVHPDNDTGRWMEATKSWAPREGK
jgi:hypothetical protein